MAYSNGGRKVRENEIAARQAQWMRFRTWEKGYARQRGEVAVRAVGEILEFYLQVSGGSVLARPSPTAKAEAIRRLRHALRFVPLAR